jgi:hypothetical protein
VLTGDNGKDMLHGRRRRRHPRRPNQGGLAGCEAELAAAERGLVITAPFGGRIAYRDPSPQTVFGSAPLLVLAPIDAFRLRLRVSTAEASALARAGETTLRVDLDGLERRFPGRLTASQPLSHDPGYVLAELACDPPAEAVRDLALGETVTASLLWTPPPYASPLFVPSAVLVVAGAAGWLILGRTSHRATQAQAPEPAPPAQPVPQPAVSLAPPGTAFAGVPELGQVAPMLRLLGSQLREGLVRGEWDESLLAAVEWLRGEASLADLRERGLNTEVVKKAKVTKKVIGATKEGDDVSILTRELELHDRAGVDFDRIADRTHGKSTQPLDVQGAALPLAVQIITPLTRTEPATDAPDPGRELSPVED